MIPSTTNQYLIAQDWTKIYQSFQNADFKSYDFETLRRTMIAYLKENYAEDFNDYINSSEFIALVDLIAFLGQNLSFRIDLNARENFLETAQRRDSILRLAQLISYNPTRNIPASGLLKIVSVSTTDSVYDSNGVNLSNSYVNWNDSTNSNWYDQFITVINSSLGGSTTFGKPNLRSVLSNIVYEQYKLNTSNKGVPLFSFSKSISGAQTNFELVSGTFANQNYVYEETPYPGNSLGILFQNDNQGSGSANTGFFMLFKQGTLSNTSFNVNNPVPNELVGINVNNINNNDVWLWQMDASGTVPSTLWSQLPSLVGSNVIYNSLSINNRNVYSVLTRNNDQIDLSFADGSFGNLPRGNFKLYYRQSDGYIGVIKPTQMSNISVQIPYTNANGQAQALTLILSLQYTVDNSSNTQSSSDIKLKAPQTYYTQNRMITGEDYNIAPLNVDNDIIKVKSINRLSSGISKYFELSDSSGAYSSTDIFAKDGILYYENTQNVFSFTFTTRNELFNIVQNNIANIVNSPSLKSFYLNYYPRIDLSYANLAWHNTNFTTNQTRGYFNSYKGPVSLGYFGNGNLSYIVPGSLIKFVPPPGKYFLPNNQLTTVYDETVSSYLWLQVVKVVGDGSNSGAGNLDDGTGPVILNGYLYGDGVAEQINYNLINILNSSIPTTTIPPFVSNLPYSIQTEIVNIAQTQKNFGLTFNQALNSWVVIVNTNLNLTGSFDLTNQGNLSNTNLDASWLIAFQWTGNNYKVLSRSLNYVFESEKQTAFYVDDSKKNYDFVNNTVVKDSIDILSFNTLPNSSSGLGTDYAWQIDSAVIESDGYIEPKKVYVSFYDNNDNGQIKDPDAFTNIVNPAHISAQTNAKDNFVYFVRSADGTRYSRYTGTIYAYPNETSVINPQDAQLYYLYDLDVVKSYNALTNSYSLQPLYFARVGRSSLKFHYVHNSGNERRIDPSKSNIIDVYLLSRSYDISYRTWLSTGNGDEPLPITTQSLENNYAYYLEPIKSISDEIVYHPAIYKVLFGNAATANLQATFKAVQSPYSTASATNLQSRILDAINSFFAIENWDFGQTFNFGELVTYVMNIMTPDITNFVIVPKSNNSVFGSLFEVTCQSNEIFISGASVSDIQIISSITASELNLSSLSSS